MVVFHPLPEEQCVNILGFDISEQKEIEETLRESEEKHRNLIEIANEGILIVNAEGRITYVNKKMAEMLVRAPDEIIGKSVLDFTDEEGKIIFEKNMKKRRHGIDESHEFKFISKDDTLLWTLVNSKSLFDKNGKFIGSMSMLSDITSRKEVEAKLKKTLDNLEEIVKKRTSELEIAYKSLKESEKGLAEAQKMAHIGNWEWEIATDKAYWSEETYRIFERAPQELAPSFSEYLSYIHPEDRDYYCDSIKKAVNGSTFVIEYRIILNDGEERILHLKSEFILDNKNRPVRIKGIVQDITERKKAEEKIQILANVVESSNDAIGTMSLNGIITSWNKGGEHVYGYSREEILGKPISILAPPNLSEETKMLSELVKQGEMIRNRETKRFRKDGKTINVSITLSPVFDMSGKLNAISFISRDISESKRAEEKLFQEKQIAEVANRTKSEFLANMSHELRTPLNSIIGFSDMLYEQAYGELNKKQLRSVGNISKSGKHLLNLINNILDISKVEAGKLKLDYKDFELATKLNLIQNLLFPIADRKNIKIEIDIDSKIRSICADEDRFVQIMYNLVDNAIKFSYENGTVKIEVRKKGDMVEIKVNDTGIGIKAEDQKKLFKPFSQVDFFSSKNYQGTGLGLSLVKQIVHLHGGYVWFRSNPGEGSTFAFTIPINNNKGNSGYVE